MTQQQYDEQVEHLFQPRQPDQRDFFQSDLDKMLASKFRLGILVGVATSAAVIALALWLAMVIYV